MIHLQIHGTVYNHPNEITVGALSNLQCRGVRLHGGVPRGADRRHPGG